MKSGGRRSGQDLQARHPAASRSGVPPFRRRRAHSCTRTISMKRATSSTPGMMPARYNAGHARVWVSKSVDDEVDGRRDQNSERAASRQRAEEQRARCSRGSVDLRDGHGADRGRRRHARAGGRREHRAGADIRVHQPAWQPRQPAARWRYRRDGRFPAAAGSRRASRTSAWRSGCTPTAFQTMSPIARCSGMDEKKWLSARPRTPMTAATGTLRARSATRRMRAVPSMPDASLRRSGPDAQ